MTMPANREEVAQIFDMIHDAMSRGCEVSYALQQETVLTGVHNGFETREPGAKVITFVVRPAPATLNEIMGTR